MSTKKYNPFELDNPTLDLGEHGSWLLADITESRQRRLEELTTRFESSDETDVNEQVDLICTLAEAACQDSDGLGAVLRGLWKDEKIGMKALTGMVLFIQEWLVGEVTGEA